MDPINLSRDSAILAQSEGQWQKYLMLLLFKLAGEQQIRLSVADIQVFNTTFASRGHAAIYVRGHSDAISFQVVDELAARRLAEHEKTQRGTA